MSKGLEALDDLRCMTSLSRDCPYKESNDLCDTIEKELEALEIIKNKGVNVERVLSIIEQVEENKIALNIYNRSCYKELTQEEYDLLKEVLL